MYASFKLDYPCSGPKETSCDLLSVGLSLFFCSSSKLSGSCTVHSCSASRLAHRVKMWVWALYLVLALPTPIEAVRPRTLKNESESRKHSSGKAAHRGNTYFCPNKLQTKENLTSCLWVILAIVAAWKVNYRQMDLSTYRQLPSWALDHMLFPNATMQAPTACIRDTCVHVECQSQL